MYYLSICQMEYYFYISLFFLFRLCHLSIDKFPLHWRKEIDPHMWCIFLTLASIIDLQFAIPWWISWVHRKENSSFLNCYHYFDYIPTLFEFYFLFLYLYMWFGLGRYIWRVNLSRGRSWFNRHYVMKWLYIYEWTRTFYHKSSS